MPDLPTFISISTPCRGVAQPGSASDILIAISMTLDEFNAIVDFNFET